MTTPFPLTKSTQIAEKSILDVFGRQTYLGNTFTLNATVSLTSATAVPLIFVNNPAGSGKALFITKMTLTGTGAVFASLDLNPVINNAGTPATPLNLRPAYGSSSVSSAATGITITTPGSVIAKAGATGTSVELNNLLILDPGYKIVVSVNAPAATGGAPVSATVGLIWWEI